ncbi:hypothetical protein LSAT2_004476, partial [Lamellibrachia satsuma]
HKRHDPLNSCGLTFSSPAAACPVKEEHRALTCGRTGPRSGLPGSPESVFVFAGRCDLTVVRPTTVCSEHREYGARLHHPCDHPCQNRTRTRDPSRDYTE